MLRAHSARPAVKWQHRPGPPQRRPRLWSSKGRPQRSKGKAKRLQPPTPSYVDALSQAVRAGAVHTFCAERPATNRDSVVHLLRTLAALYDKHRLSVEELSCVAPLLSEALWHVTPRLSRQHLQRTVQSLAKLQLQPTPALWEHLMLRAHDVYARTGGGSEGATAVRPSRYDASWLHSLEIARMLDAGAAQGLWQATRCGDLTVHHVSMPVRFCSTVLQDTLGSTLLSPAARLACGGHRVWRRSGALLSCSTTYPCS